MPTDLKKILESKHPIYVSHEAALRREERRHEGGDAVLEELRQWTGFETTAAFDIRKGWAQWMGFGKKHTGLISGHILRELSTPNYGPGMGKVRPRSELQGKQSLAELFHYNVNGIGKDGLELPTYIDHVVQKALSCYWRWLMVELPTPATLRAIRYRLTGRDIEIPANAPLTMATVTEEEQREGFRPYWVHRSALAGWNWRFVDEVLQWVNFKIPAERALDFDDEAGAASTTAGKPWSYLLVRKGYEGLGKEFRDGGWWKYDAEHAPKGQGTWDDTDGEIPCWLQVGLPGEGTFDRPSIGQSVTMELGQIDADLMNAISERRHNLRQAAKSVDFGLGVGGEVQKLVADQLGEGSVWIGVPATQTKTGEIVVPQIHNSSSSVISETAWSTYEDAAMLRAKEIMVRQVTAGANASGERVEAEHAAQTSPMLARVAAATESAINTGLYFTGRRFGLTREQALAISVTLPREFPLRDFLADVDSMLGVLKEAGVRSRTWEASLLLQKGDKLNVLPEEDRDTIEGELEDTGRDREELERIKLQSEALDALMRNAGNIEEAAKKVGFTAADIRKLFGPGERRALVNGQLPEGVTVDRRQAVPPMPADPREAARLARAQRRGVLPIPAPAPNGNRGAA